MSKITIRNQHFKIHNHPDPQHWYILFIRSFPPSFRLNFSKTITEVAGDEIYSQKDAFLRHLPRVNCIAPINNEAGKLGNLATFSKIYLIWIELGCLYEILYDGS